MEFLIKRLKDLSDFDITLANELWRLSDAEEEGSDPTDYDTAATKSYLEDSANIVEYLGRAILEMLLQNQPQYVNMVTRTGKKTTRMLWLIFFTTGQQILRRDV